MPNRERRKGLRGEAEVAAIFTAHDMPIRSLEGGGDHWVRLAVDGTLLHVEAKRQNRIRTAWIEQAEGEAPAGAVPVVAWRPDGGRWWAMIPLEDLARLLA